MFAGRQVIKAIVFVSSGLVGALVGAVIGGLLLGVIGLGLGAIAGFFIAGFIGYSLLFLGVGLITGYFAYEFLRLLSVPFLVAIFFGFVFFVIGLLLANRFLELATAIAGGFIFFSVGSLLGLPLYISFIAAFVLASLGYFSQVRSKSSTFGTASKL